MKLKYLLAGAALCAAPLAAHAATQAPSGAQPIAGVKNIIILINDGAGFTVYDAGRLYNGKPLTTDGAGFVQTSVSTYPLRPDSQAAAMNNNVPGSTAQDPRSVYDSSLFWDTTPVGGPSMVRGYDKSFSQAGFSDVPTFYPAGTPVNFYNGAGLPTTPGALANPSSFPAAFQGYEFSRFAHPDSGNTATSISSGVKTYNNAINVDGAGDPQIAIVDIIGMAHSVGKSAGVVTAVEFSDATPAALGGAHNIARANHGEIANEMFSKGYLQVIGGAGNPDYNNDGLPQTPVYAPPLPANGGGWIYANLWADLKNNTNTSGKNPFLFPLIQDKEAVQALAAKSGAYKKPPARIAMIVKGFTSTQFNRTNVLKRPDGTNIDATQDVPYGTPLKTNVPTQAELTVAALNVLDQNGRGFYLMSEAGAVDRAEHANNTARMIEELNASDDTVKAIIDWVNRKDTAASWSNTLLIVTADHDHLLYGPNGDTVPFQTLQDNGPGKVPGNKWFGPNHGVGLVPLYAYGQGAAAIASLATKTDRFTAQNGVTYGHGAYVDQTELGAVLKATAAQTTKKK